MQKSLKKQKIATYILHEKYGHGFFYAQSKLGQQIILLEKNRSKLEPGDGSSLLKLIKDSALIVNEGFSAWLELTFLPQLNQEIRQVAELRETFLLYDSVDLEERQKNSEYFSEFPAQYRTSYREGFEALEFIAAKLGFRCAVQAFLVATDINLGIAIDEQQQFVIDAEQIKSNVLNKNDFSWRAQDRLRCIRDAVEQNLGGCVEVYDCHQSCQGHSCQLQSFFLSSIENGKQ